MMSTKQTATKTQGRNHIENPISPHPLCDIGVNLTNRAFRNHWREVVQRSSAANVRTLILTGTSMKSSEDVLNMAQTWKDELHVAKSRNNGSESAVATADCELYVTVGIHPHDAKTFHGDGTTVQKMKDMLLSNPSIAKAVGECGLDYNRNYSSRKDQLKAFRAQVALAVELKLPLFLHEREAHDDLISVLDEFQRDGEELKLPHIVVHCFTGTSDEAAEYIQRGYYIGFTGTICKKERGAPLRDILQSNIVPLNRIMIETDAPFMGFVKGRKSSEPAHVVGVAEQVAKCLGVSVEEVCRVTTENARSFFGLS